MDLARRLAVALVRAMKQKLDCSRLGSEEMKQRQKFRQHFQKVNRAASFGRVRVEGGGEAFKRLCSKR